ncbi:SDR family oxidoreductase [Streptomyces cyaneochromogenes]|uniref:SDR family oxidoreductase n=1 Tax=Streptomyces cyaneochromogenes TaxID=2496836 RepID=A0A3S9MKS6_9ACTN|nr:SDR family oxidoreductase [Streptomyces cyaneochromogenes]AZQ39768.1 SDR family oxidoreductase [Streptomyces cyaneochromogenes]
MLLRDKVALVYGAGGAIGGAAARAFAREGAKVFLAGRTAAPLDKLAEDIRAAGADAETAMVDAQDEAAVDAFVDGVAARAGRIDVSFNAIGYGDVQKPLMEISEADFLRPIVTAMRSQFLTTRAAARHMTARGTGVILAFGGGGTQTLPGLGGFKIALDALEGLRRQWAIELGPQGIRVVTLKSGGVPESLPTGFPGAEAIVGSLVDATQLGRTATLADVGDVAAFVASDRARTLTATDVNISCGAIVD